MFKSAYLGDIDATSATDDEGVGTLRWYDHPTYGWQKYRWVQNTTGGALSAGLGVMQANGTGIYTTTLSGATTPNARVLGVAQAAIPSTYYGWVLCDGIGTFQSDGSTTANTIQICAANGLFTDGTAVTSEGIVWAQATETPAGSGGTFQGRITAC